MNDDVDEMLALVWSFPSLQNYSGVVHGTRMRFDATDFEQWARGGHATSGTVHAARFILEVWGGSWSKKACPWKIGRFGLRDALASWDKPHLDAFAAWVLNPRRVWP